jgi:hypothetical protein
MDVDLVPDEEKIKYLNRLINCIDPAKDAMIKFTTTSNEIKELTAEIHGKFLKHDVIISMFDTPQNLNDTDRRFIRGVGYEKDYLKTKISKLLKLGDIPQQEVIRLKFSIIKDLRLDEGLNLSYDAGPGPGNFCKNYKLVLTPGSVIDSAKKGKTHISKIDMLSNENILSDTIIKGFDLSPTLQSVEFRTGSVYTFNIKTTIPDFKNTTIIFNKNTFNEDKTKYCAGNPTKNEYIYNNWKDRNKINEIKFRVLMKELGDTLQVAWLKDTILKNHLIVCKTAICTSDTTVWLRSILNGVSCIYTNVNKSIFYPIGSIEGSELIKHQNERKLELNNAGVINTLINFKKYIDDKENNNLDFHNKKLSDKNKVFMSNILTKVINALEIINNDILDKLRSINRGSKNKGYYKKHSEIVAKNLFKSPFRIFGERDVEHFSTFTHFINIDGEKRYEFNVNFIYRLLYFNENITENQIIGKDLQAFINLSRRKRPRTGGSVNTENVNTESKVNIKDIIEKNINKPGFLAYYTMIHLSELIYIIYSISFVYKLNDKEKYANLFKSNDDVNIKLTESFGKLNNDNTYDYNPPTYINDLINYDNLFIDIYQYLIYFKEKSIAKNHNIFNLCYNEINWMFDYIKSRVKIPEYNIDLNSTEKQSLVLDIYQELYDAEVYLTTLNKRGEKTPVEIISDSLISKSINKTKKRRITQNTNNRTLRIAGRVMITPERPIRVASRFNGSNKK